MLDMNELEDQPLGYLLYRVTEALSPEATAALDPLEVALPEFVCMRILAMRPGRSNAELARDINVSPQAMNMVLRGLDESRDSSVRAGQRVVGPCADPPQLTRGGRANC